MTNQHNTPEQDITLLLAFAEKFRYPRLIVTQEEIKPGEMNWRRFVRRGRAQDIQAAVARVKRLEARLQEEAS